jgi:hypothetical protein
VASARRAVQLRPADGEDERHAGTRRELLLRSPAVFLVVELPDRPLGPACDVFFSAEERREVPVRLGPRDRREHQSRDSRARIADRGDAVEAAPLQARLSQLKPHCGNRIDCREAMTLPRSAIESELRDKAAGCVAVFPQIRGHGMQRSREDGKARPAGRGCSLGHFGEKHRGRLESPCLCAIRQQKHKCWP